MGAHGTSKQQAMCSTHRDIWWPAWAHQQDRDTYILSHQCVSSDVVLNSADVKNSFHTKSMNVVSPSNELSAESSGLRPTNILQLKLLVLKMNFVHGDFI